MMKRLLNGAAVLAVLAALVLTSGCPNKQKIVPELYQVSYGVQGTGGTVSAKAGGKAMESGSTLEKGVKVIFTAVPAPGYEIDKWLLNGKTDSAGGNKHEYMVTVTGKTEVRLVFKEKEKPKISITVKGDDGITVNTATLTVDKGALWKNIQTDVTAAMDVKDSYEFIGWKLGGASGTDISGETVFSADSIVYAVSREVVRINGTGDERVEPFSFTIPKGTAWKDARVQAEAALKLKAEWQGGDYGAYRWQHTDESGAAFTDGDVLTGGETVYVCTNYLKFKIEGTELKGYTGGEPRGRITIPDSVTVIGDRAFSNCVRLTGLSLGSGIQYTSFSSAFFGCNKITRLTVDSGNSMYCSIDNIIYTKDKKTLVYAARGLTAVTIPDHVTAIGNGAFEYCKGLTGTLSIPNSVKTIGRAAFRSCKGLTSLNLGSSVTTIGFEVFKGCSKLTSAVFADKNGWAVYYDEQYKKIC